LTFMEGYALSLAITEWSNKFLEQEKWLLLNTKNSLN
jgi:hypothetical protein